ncbi:hypothetical protein HC749_14235 [Arthrobacter sp. S13_S34]|nr:hypothetical protein [Arthrobacter sp. S13_S34]
MNVLEVAPEAVWDSGMAGYVPASGLLSGWLAHKTSLAEVLLTQVLPLPDNRATVHLQWPRSHYFYETQSGSADTLLLAESLRQITVGIAHEVYGVPTEMKFVLSALEIKNDFLIPDFSRMTPTDVMARVLVDGIVQRRSGLNALRINVAFLVGSKPFASGSLAAQIVSPHVYARFRHGKVKPTNLADPMPSAKSEALPCGRTGQGDRVVERLPSGQGWRLTPDSRHPLLFDHPLDHISGMFVVEAIRQSFMQLRRGCTGEPAAVAVKYRKMIELSSECFLRVRQEGNAKMGWLRFDFIQDGELVAQANVDPGPPPGAVMPPISTATLE